MSGWVNQIWNNAFCRKGPNFTVPYENYICGTNYTSMFSYPSIYSGGLFYTPDTNLAYNNLQQTIFNDQIDFINREGKYSFSGQLKNNFSDMFASLLPGLALGAIGNLFGGGRRSGHGHDGCSCG